jgi:hypothetical protein
MIVNETAIHHRPKTSKQIKSLWRLLIPSYLNFFLSYFVLFLLPHIWKWMSILLSTIQNDQSYKDLVIFCPMTLITI